MPERAQQSAAGLDDGSPRIAAGREMLRAVVPGEQLTPTSEAPPPVFLPRSGRPLACARSADSRARAVLAGRSRRGLATMPVS